jgi:hypothetical protein
LQEDSADSAPSAVVTTYGSAPSLGTSAGIFTTQTVNTAVLAAQSTLNNFAQNVAVATLNSLQKQLVLHQNEALCVNARSVTQPSGFTATISFGWVEISAP